ncbi:hypothetical protein AYL99_00382 [Fonsecaea erecta]|uniref:Uncharacterized protein n=1 Tax=Fonsecaea erecta TaxID=1367422 RepID=A0A178ZX53_9EURO|nr:hypothetical protein AYL99_00382 [Fonsecaea erecta]OAP64410.1 hypothetical protein AYL99_00382 [Fonsecaea erecta]
MAPSTAFQKTKSGGRTFSPPRPGGKSKVTTKSTKEKGAAARHSLGAMGNSKVHKQQQQRKPKAGQRPKPRKPARRGDAGTMRAILRAGGDSDSEEEEEDDDDDHGGGAEDENLDDEEDEDDDEDGNDDEAQEDENESEEEEASLAHDHDLNLSSPEPDFILAEVSTTTTGGRRTNTTSSPFSSTDPPIPLPLVHRIMHAHFSRPEQTSISSDARQLVGKYVEIFVKEAIRRCVDDKRERAAHGTGDDAVVGDTGWLEVEDLERVGVQLCLDF